MFTFHHDLDAIKQSVNSSITGTASNRSTTGPMAAFCRKLWDAVDDAVGGLNDITAILSFSPDALEIDDPFREDKGCMYIHHLIVSDRWSINYFFWSRKLRRILLLTCKALSMSTAGPFSYDDSLSDRPLTPGMLMI